MSTRAYDAVLHAAVLAAPDDDVPRLVYADWLTEQGDPRGEFIVGEVARARLPPGDPRAKALAARRDELWRENHDAWAKPAPGLFVSLDDVRRGFVEQLHDYLGDDAVVLSPAAVRDACLRSLVLCNPATFDLIDRGLRGVTSLTLNMDLSPARLAEVLAHPAFARLERLELAGAGKQVDHVRAIGDAMLPDLRSLAITSLGKSYGGAAAGTFAGFASWRGSTLRAMRLDDSPIGAGGLAAVLDGPAFAVVESLTLPGSGLAEVDIEALCASPAPLVALHVSDNDLGPGAARAIATTPRFTALRSLGLARTNIGDAGLAALIASPHLPSSLALALDGELLGLGVDVWIDGTAVTGASWIGEPSGPVTQRFAVHVHGAPTWDTCLKHMPA